MNFSNEQLINAAKARARRDTGELEQMRGPVSGLGDHELAMLLSARLADAMRMMAEKDLALKGMRKLVGVLEDDAQLVVETGYQNASGRGE